MYYKYILSVQLLCSLLPRHLQVKSPKLNRPEASTMHLKSVLIYVAVTTATATRLDQKSWHITSPTSFTEMTSDAISAIDPSPEWTYGPHNGPLQWGKFEPICQHGKHQSPINFNDLTPTFNTSAARMMYARYTAVPFVITHHTAQLQLQDLSTAGGIVMDGAEYKLMQFHFHVPGEHRLLGKGWPMEVHFVHETPNITPSKCCSSRFLMRERRELINLGAKNSLQSSVSRYR
jgi:carbonic anhydrase